MTKENKGHENGEKNDYHKAANKLLSLVSTITFSTQHFRYHSEQIAYIYCRLRDSEKMAEETIMSASKLSAWQWEQVYIRLLGAVTDTAQYALLLQGGENVQALYKCLEITQICADVFLKPPADYDIVAYAIDATIKAILTPHIAPGFVYSSAKRRNELRKIMHLVGEELSGEEHEKI